MGDAVGVDTERKRARSARIDCRCVDAVHAERVPLETSSLTVLALLAIGFDLFPLRAGDGTLRGVDFLAGFGHLALIAVSALTSAGQGLARTGALDPAGRWRARNWLSHPRLALLGMMVASVFVNNTPLVVLSLPLLVSVAASTLRYGVRYSRAIAPLANTRCRFASDLQCVGPDTLENLVACCPACNSMLCRSSHCGPFRTARNMSRSGATQSARATNNG